MKKKNLVDSLGEMKSKKNGKMSKLKAVLGIYETSNFQREVSIQSFFNSQVPLRLKN